jgi:hypothetical protein
VLLLVASSAEDTIVVWYELLLLEAKLVLAEVELYTLAFLSSTAGRKVRFSVNCVYY